MESTLEQWPKKWVGKFLLGYTLAFTITFLLAYSPFLKAGKSFIWSIDGTGEHFPALVYIGQYWRGLIAGIFHGNFEIPLFDLTMGLGENIIGALNYYGLGDPLTFLSTFVPVRYTEYLYNFLVVFRLYLSGLSFCMLCLYHGKCISHTLIGSLVYVFCGYTTYFAVRHPFFINPMIQLPLLLVGAEEIIRKRKPYLFILMVFYSALCGFYFLYMMTIMTAIYIFVRFFVVVREHKAQEFIKITGRSLGSYCLGISMAGMLFFPSVLAFLSSSRSDYEVQVNLFSFGKDYYESNLPGIISAAGSENRLSLAAIVLPALALLFWEAIRRKKHGTLLALFAFVSLCYIIPFGGYMMNGFGYTSQRWAFAAALLFAYITVEMLPVMLNLGSGQKLFCLCILFAYGWIILSNAKIRSVDYVVGVAMLAAVLCVLFFLNSIQAQEDLWYNIMDPRNETTD